MRRRGHISRWTLNALQPWRQRWRTAASPSLAFCQPALPAPVGAAPWPAWRSQDGQVARTSPGPVSVPGRGGPGGQAIRAGPIAPGTWYGIGPVAVRPPAVDRLAIQATSRRWTTPRLLNSEALPESSITHRRWTLSRNWNPSRNGTGVVRKSIQTYLFTSDGER
jgi:hypothetical protein